MFERASYDALVVGARCAGAAAAMMMARHGLRVLLVDRGDYGTDTLSTHALMRAGVLQLKRWGVLPRIQAAGTPPVRATTFHYGDEVVEIEVASSNGVDALYAPRRTVLDSALVDAAWDARVEIRHGCTLVDLDRGPDGRVRGATLADRAGTPHHVTASLVVGADGMGSTVARLVGATVQRESKHASAAVYAYTRALHPSGYHWYFTQDATAGVIPTNAGRSCVFAAVPAARFRHDLRGPDGYHRVLARMAPDVAAAIAAVPIEEPPRAFAGRRGFMRQPYGPGWALVGDAGYFKDPLTAHGLTDALRDAQLVAAAAARGSARAFADYAALREELSVPLFEATDAIVSFDWDLDSVRRHHQDLNRAMKREVEWLTALGQESKQMTSPGPRVRAMPYEMEATA
jgi:2-polyprenyl-6-methoxyphenol hydroxylase-like FAD-dependent oxidoreductase